MRQRRREERLKRIETEDETAELSVDAPGGVLEEGSKFVSGGGGGRSGDKLLQQ